MTARRADRTTRADAIAAVLQRYADRGVFRSLTSERGGGIARFDITWLTRRPTAMHVSRDGSRLTFPALLPSVKARSAIANDVSSLLEHRTSRKVPAHKRLDRRRASLTGSARRGAWTLGVDIAGDNGPYAVRYALNLVNEIFLLLHERYPEYLVAEFGISSE